MRLRFGSLVILLYSNTMIIDAIKHVISMFLSVKSKGQITNMSNSWRSMHLHEVQHVDVDGTSMLSQQCSVQRRFVAGG